MTWHESNGFHILVGEENTETTKRLFHSYGYVTANQPQELCDLNNILGHSTYDRSTYYFAKEIRHKTESGRSSNSGYACVSFLGGEVWLDYIPTQGVPAGEKGRQRLKSTFEDVSAYFSKAIKALKEYSLVK